MPIWISQRRTGRRRVNAFANPKSESLSLALLLCLIVLAAISPSKSPAQARRPASPTTEKKPPTREAYVGDQACRSCHEKEFTAYQATAHHLTSRLADAHSIAGSFTIGSNLFKTANPSLYFKMTSDSNGYYQTAVDEVSPGKNVELTQRFDIVVGVRKSQTYLYWKDDELFELPVSWWSANGPATAQWINSPGYEDGAAPLRPPHLSALPGMSRKLFHLARATPE